MISKNKGWDKWVGETTRTNDRRNERIANKQAKQKQTEQDLKKRMQE